MNLRPRLHAVATFVAGLFCLVATNSMASLPGTPRVATIAPRDSSFHKRLEALNAEWSKGPGGIHMDIFTGGAMGGELSIVRRMQNNQLQGAMLTSVGLGQIDKSVTALQLMPLMFRDWDDVDRVREALRPDLERRLQLAGYVVLFWADAGWVRYFSRTPIERIADLRPLRVLASDGDPDSIRLMSSYYTPVVLEPDKIYLSLRNRMIDAAPVPAFLANAMQVAAYAPYMVDLRWAPITGAFVVRKSYWDSLDSTTRAWLRESSERAGQDLRRITRSEDEQAILAMQQKQGLKIVKLSPDAEAEWRAEVAKMYPKLRGSLVPADMFDAVVRILGDHAESAR